MVASSSFPSFHDVTSLHRFSRRIMWAHTAFSNNNPRIIARFYLDTVEEIGGMSS